MPNAIKISVRRILNISQNWRVVTYRSFSYTPLLLNDNVIARKWLDNLNSATMEPRYFHVRFDRSSGPGGQNVNKVNTKCTLTLPDFSSCSLFPGKIKDQLIAKKMKYYSANSDSIVIQSDEMRSREQNRIRCFEKLVNMIKETCYFAKEANIDDVKRWESIKQKTKKLRLKQKKFNSEKKKSRRQMF